MSRSTPKRFRTGQRVLGILMLLSLFVISGLRVEAQDGTLWVTGYLPCYHQGDNGDISFMTAEDYSRLTLLNHHALYINPDATINYAANSVTPTKQQRAVQIAHDHNLPINLVFQAWDTDYVPAISTAAQRTQLVNALMTELDTYGYDGLDVDLEPVLSEYIAGLQTENPNYIAFVNELWTALQTRTRVINGVSRPPLLTAAMNGYAGPVFNILEDKFDQINIMTYDMAGPWPGWVVWHDSAVYNGGYTFPGSSTSYLTSVHGEVQKAVNAGVSPAKLGIGISYDAFRWQGGSGVAGTEGVTKPRDQYTTAPSWTRFSYSYLKEYIYNADHYHWDDVTQTSYLSFDRAGASNDEFWSFNDETACAAKVEYIQDQDLGGLIIWELYGGYIPANPAGERMPQLAAIYSAKTGIPVGPPPPFAAEIAPLGPYEVRLSWATDPQFTEYWVWRGATPYFTQSDTLLGVVSAEPWEWPDENAYRQADLQYYYRIEGKGGAPGAYSVRLGWFSFPLASGD